jgi:hypothetical protein
MPLHKSNEAWILSFYSWTFKKIELTNKLSWLITVSIENTIDETDRKYLVLFRWDPSIREDAIQWLHDQWAKEIHKVKTQLLSERSTDEIDAEYRHKVKEAEKELEMKILENEDQLFKATIKKVEYKGWETIVTLFVWSHSIIASLDAIKDSFQAYKIALIDKDIEKELDLPISISDIPKFKTVVADLVS